MRFKLEVRPEAFADVAEAFSYYESQRAGLGDEFEAELHQAMQLLGELARAGPVVYRRLRRVLMQRFPFAVYYRVSGETVEVRGVIHSSRDPRTWKRRA